MSTRAQVMYEGMPGIYIYQHSDGYPDGEHGMLAKLARVVDRVKERKGDDEYVFARIIQAMMADSPNGITGYGVGTGIHGDTEHLYTITRELTFREVEICA